MPWQSFNQVTHRIPVCNCYCLSKLGRVSTFRPQDIQRVPIPLKYRSRKSILVKIEHRCLRSNQQATQLSADVALQLQIPNTTNCCNVCLYLTLSAMYQAYGYNSANIYCLKSKQESRSLTASIKQHSTVFCGKPLNFKPFRITIFYKNMWGKYHYSSYR